MINIIPVESTRRIWQIENLLLPEQVADILTVDWLSMPWSRGSKQERWARRWIDLQHPTIQRLSSYVESCMPTINQALGTNYVRCNSAWWIDEPGFTVTIHTDGELPNAMQLSWIAPSDAYGTRFYYNKSGHPLMYQALGQVNTGYMMLNHPDESGVQPLLWHGMLNPVPLNSFRLCSYHQFTNI